jgi:hypothetical protein
LVALIEINEVKRGRSVVEVAEEIRQRIRDIIDSKVNVRVDSFTLELSEEDEEDEDIQEGMGPDE